MNKIAIAAVATGLLVLGGCGITGNLRLNPGYADLGSPGWRDTNRKLGLSLGPLPIRLARAITADDPEIAGILRSLKAVRVYVYEVDGNAERVHQRLDATRARLVTRGWHPLLAVRDDGELVSALVRLEGEERIRGLVVMVQDGEDVVLVNVIGAIEPETFALVMDEVGIEMPRMALALPQDCADRPVREAAIWEGVKDDVVNDLELPDALRARRAEPCTAAAWSDPNEL